jgi:HEAT repeat protein
MAKRLTTEDHLARLRQLRDAPEAAHDPAALRAILTAPAVHGIVIKRVAELASQWQARSLAPDLAAAALRLAPPDGVKRDPGCEGKAAALRTLLEWDADLPDLYLQAARWVQNEPVQKGSIDTAGECRGLAAIGISATCPPNALDLLVDLLADADHHTRAHAAIAVGNWRGPEAVPLLRLKARVGDDQPEVLGEVFAALLRSDAREQFPFVARFLEDPNPAVVEAAALAIGQARPPDALPALTAAFRQYQRHPIHSSLLMAIALLRSEASLDWFLVQLQAAPESLAMKLIDALGIYRNDARVADRIRPLAERHRETAALFRQLFG